MQKTGHNLIQALIALLLAACILFVSLFLAKQAEQTSVYRQSRVISSIVTQDSVGVGELLKDRKNIRMMALFAGAVTSAYINFELIPLHEGTTFAVVFESLSDQITVEKFEYQRRNLVIYGTAESEEACEAFADSLRSKEYFETVAGDWYLTTDNNIRFQITCVAATAGNGLGFVQSD